MRVRRLAMIVHSIGRPRSIGEPTTGQRRGKESFGQWSLCMYRKNHWGRARAQYSPKRTCTARVATKQSHLPGSNHYHVGRSVRQINANSQGILEGETRRMFGQHRRLRA